MLGVEELLPRDSDKPEAGLQVGERLLERGAARRPHGSRFLARRHGLGCGCALRQLSLEVLRGGPLVRPSGTLLREYRGIAVRRARCALLLDPRGPRGVPPADLFFDVSISCLVVPRVGGVLGCQAVHRRAQAELAEGPAGREPSAQFRSPRVAVPGERGALISGASGGVSSHVLLPLARLLLGSTRRGVQRLRG